MTDEERSHDKVVASIGSALVEEAMAMPTGTEISTYELLKRVANRDDDAARLLCAEGQHDSSCDALVLLVDVNAHVRETLEGHGIYPESLWAMHAVLGLPYHIQFTLRRRVCPDELAVMDEPPKLEGLHFESWGWDVGAEELIAYMRGGQATVTCYSQHSQYSDNPTSFIDLTQEQWSDLERTLYDLGVFRWRDEHDPWILDGASWKLMAMIEGGHYFKAGSNFEEPSTYPQLLEHLRALGFSGLPQERIPHPSYAKLRQSDG